MPPNPILKISAFFFSLFCTFILQSFGQSGADKPNIIFIMADDLGYADLGCYGQKIIATPNIDKMASEGTLFTQVYSGSPVCAPARSTLMTGQHTGHTTVRGNFSKGVEPVSELAQAGRVPLNAEDVTVAEVLQDAGYVTGMTGKWGLGEPSSTGEPNRQGFDEWYGYLNQARAHHYYPEYLWKNEELERIEGNYGDQGSSYSHDLFTDFALEFIENHKDEPFFLYLPYTLPHGKYQIPDLGEFEDKPWTENEKVFAAMVTLLDKDVGRILELLEKEGIADKTLVFFCSDNGAAQRWDGLFDSSGLLHGKKRDMYEGGIRVPMIAWWPGHVPAGAVSNAPWYFPDVLPTLAAVAGVDAPEGLDGINVLPVILGKPQDTSDRFFYWEFYERGYEQAVRWRNWKVIRLEPNSPPELYDLSVDPGEANNVAAEHPEIVAKIEDYLKSARTESSFWKAPHER